MPAFEYQALDTSGRTVKGVVEGDAERQVRTLLRDQGLMPLQVDAVAATGAARLGLSIGLPLANARASPAGRIEDVRERWRHD